MADVEEDVRKQFFNQVKELEEELRKKQEVIEQLKTKNVKTVLTPIESRYIFCRLIVRTKLK